jgi:hypothetical protein
MLASYGGDGTHLERDRVSMQFPGVPRLRARSERSKSIARMSLTFQGPNGAFERRWIVYAMLRDNVQHHLENGAPTEAFSALHALSAALLRGEVSVPARKLHAELAEARGLLDRPIEDLAVSVRTRAICALMFPLPSLQETELASRAEWTAPFPTAGAQTLGDLFGSLVEELLRITERASAEDVLTAIDQ